MTVIILFWEIFFPKVFYVHFFLSKTVNYAFNTPLGNQCIFLHNIRYNFTFICEHVEPHTVSELCLEPYTFATMAECSYWMKCKVFHVVFLHRSDWCDNWRTRYAVHFFFVRCERFFSCNISNRSTHQY